MFANPEPSTPISTSVFSIVSACWSGVSSSIAASEYSHCLPCLRKRDNSSWLAIFRPGRFPATFARVISITRGSFPSRYTGFRW